MSSIAHTFEDLYRQREEANDERRWSDETQVSVRLGPDVITALDYLARDLGISRTATARHIIAAGVHDALDAADAALVIAGDGNWQVISKGQPFQ